MHSRHQYHWHTGYVPPQTVACPHLGAWMARVLGPRNPVIPPFVNIGQRLEGVGEKEELKAFTTAGFFGSEYGPMNLPYPERAAASVQPPKGMTAGRYANRARLFRKLVDQNPNREVMSDYQRQSMLRSLENADRLIASKDREAFDIGLEPKESRERYDTGRFGQRLPAGATAGRIRRALCRGDDGIRALPALGHAQRRPHDGRPHAQGNGPADRAADSRPGGARNCWIGRW